MIVTRFIILAVLFVNSCAHSGGSAPKGELNMSDLSPSAELYFKECEKDQENAREAFTALAQITGEKMVTPRGYKIKV
jgi:hypothetical protein